MTTLPDIVSRARDLVDSYENILTQVKILRVQVIDSPEKYDVFGKELDNIIRETREFLQLYSSIEYDQNDYYGRYLRTYYNYLVLISIPYLIDLLKELRNNIDHSRRKYVDKHIAELNAFLERYKSTFDETNESTP
jgi:hypothetical protein